MHNTMQMTAENKQTSKSVNNADTGNESERSPPRPQKNCTRSKKQTKMQQATTKICCESNKDPHFLRYMENIKQTQREKRVLVGEWGASVGEMTYPSLSALVDGAGAGTVTVPTLSSLI